jgi:cold shock CspA family protein
MFGSVIDYTVEKGYGFIRYSLYGQDKKIFAHHSQIICLGFRKLHDDQEVSFEIGEQEGRPWAMRIKNPDGTPIAETDADGNVVERAAKVPKLADPKKPFKNRYAHGGNFALRLGAELLPVAANNQDEVLLGESCEHVGHVVALFEGHLHLESTTGNECSKFVKDRLLRNMREIPTKKEDVDLSDTIHESFDLTDKEFLEQARHPRRNFTDAASACALVFFGDVPQFALVQLGGISAVRKQTLKLLRAKSEL